MRGEDWDWGGGGRKRTDWGRQVAPQCWVLTVETPLRLACVGHKWD